jgi:hypothetical protein
MVNQRGSNVAKLKTIQWTLYNLNVRFKRISEIYIDSSVEAEDISDDFDLCITNAINDIDIFIDKSM